MEDVNNLLAEAFEAFEIENWAKAKDKAKAIAMHQIGMVYRMDRRYNDAFEMFSKEKKIRETSLNHDFVGFSANAYEFGQIMLEKEHFEQAFTYFRQALAYGETANDLICIACAKRGLGTYYARISDIENAKRYFKESISTFNGAGDIQG